MSRGLFRLAFGTMPSDERSRRTTKGGSTHSQKAVRRMATAKIHSQWKKKGLCTSCGSRPAIPHRTKCLQCKASHTRWVQNNPSQIKQHNHKAERTPNRRLSRRKRQLKNARGISSNLTLPIYLQLLQKPCCYCTGALPEAGIGLDRIDNRRGYDVDNVVTCCGGCNTYREQESLTHQQMLLLRPQLTRLRRAISNLPHNSERTNDNS